MKTTYFKFIAQKTADDKTILVAVIPDDMLGKDLPTIIEGQAFLMPATIYTGTYPQIKINSDTIVDRTEELKGKGIAGIITSEQWYIKNDIKEDIKGDYSKTPSMINQAKKSEEEKPENDETTRL
jgi:hypothetical protein